MKRHLVLAAFLAFAALGLPAGSRAQGAAPADTPAQAEALLRGVEADLARNGLAQGIGPHVPDLEQALRSAPRSFPSVTVEGTTTVLADGLPEILLATATGASNPAGASTRTVVMRNPYQAMSLMLGSYYNEIGRPDDALRILSAGLALSPFPGMRMGATVPGLISERAVSLAGLKRFDEALAAYDEGLTIKSLPVPDQARFHRGRGFALTEMGRLDDAEAAYHEALKLDPNDARAQHELLYIAGLRAGRPATPGYMATKPPAPEQDAPRSGEPAPPPPEPPRNPIAFHHRMDKTPAPLRPIVRYFL